MTAPVRWITDGVRQASLTYRSPALLMVGGVPGSGKSDLIRRCVPAGAVVLDADQYRGQVQHERGLPREAFYPSCIPEARDRFLRDLRAAADARRNIVVDAALLSAHSRDELARTASEHALQSHLLVVCATLQQCLEGVANRARTVQPDHVERYWSMWESLRAELEAGRCDAALSSVTVVDRQAAGHLRQVIFN